MRHLMCALAVGIAMAAVPAVAETSVDDLRALVMAGDIAPVEATLRAAEAADMAAQGEPYRQRGLFHVFRETAPGVDAFLAKWRVEDPTSAQAMTAEGWHLFAAAWNARGEAAARDVYPVAMQAFTDDFTKARDLAARAILADPDLIAASDLLLVTASKLDHGAGLLAELDRVMTRHPNRGSLLNATDGLAPQWGWWPWVSQALCAHYAPMIKSVPNYDTGTCDIDVVYSAGYPLGPEMQKAHDDLQTNDNPVLDYARLQEATFFQIPDQHRISVLEATKAKRPLNFAEAQQLDLARAAVAGTPETTDERKLAAADELLWRRKLADYDPTNPKAVLGYIAAQSTAVWLLQVQPDQADWVRRLKRLVSKMPYSTDAWTSLGQMTTADLWSGKIEPSVGGKEIDLIAEAEPYFTNAIVYSNYTYQSLNAAMAGKVWAVTDRVNLMYPTDPEGGTPDQNKRLEEVVYCPLIREVRITKYLCDQRVGTGRECGSDPLILPDVEVALKKVTDRGVCHQEATLPIEELAFSPVAVQAED